MRTAEEAGGTRDQKSGMRWRFDARGEGEKGERCKLKLVAIFIVFGSKKFASRDELEWANVEETEAAEGV